MINRPLACVLFALIVAGCASEATRSADSISLFNGTDMSEWHYGKGGPVTGWNVAKGVSLNPENPHLFVIEPGTGVFYNGAQGKDRNIFSRTDHGDAAIHVEFCVSSNSNSGVYVQGRYEVQILDSWGKPNDHLKYGDCGGIYQRWKDDHGYEGTAPRINASKRPGEWQSFDIVFRAPRFDDSGKKTENGRFVKVYHNGKLIHENVEVTGPTRSPGFNNEAPLGPIMLQGDHGPVAFRNLRIKPLHLP
jgi:hypothetical protein